MRHLAKSLRNFTVANLFAVLPLFWAVFGWMPDQVKVWMRGEEEAPGVIESNGTAMSGEEYGEWRGGRIFRFYLQSGMTWKNLVFRFPGSAGTMAVEKIELQKGKLLSLIKSGSALMSCGGRNDEYMFKNSRFDAFVLLPAKSL